MTHTPNPASVHLDIDNFTRDNTRPQPVSTAGGALAEFIERYPTWWYTIGICDLTRDFTAAPQAHSPDEKYIRVGNAFDAGFSCDHHGTIDDAIRDVMEQIETAISAIEERET